MFFKDHKNISKKIDNLESELLKTVGNRNPFTVPDNYFDEFQNQLTYKIKNKELPSPTEKISFTEKYITRLLKPQLAIAASLAILFVVASIITFNQIEKTNEKTNIVNTNYKVILKQKQFISENNNPVEISIVGDEEKKQVIVHLSESAKIEEVSSLINKKASFLPNYIKQQVAQIVVNKVIDTNPLLFEKKLTEQETSANQANNINFAQNNSNFISNQISKTNSPIAKELAIKPKEINENNYSNINQITLNNEINKISRTKLHPNFILPQQICKEEPFELVPDIISEKYLYKWSTGDTTPTIYVKESGIYKLTLFCTENPEVFSISETKVTIIPRPTISLSGTAILCSDSQLELKPDIENSELYTYFWLPNGETKPNITVRNPGMHVLTVTACNTYFDTVFVQKEHCDVVFPNVITPNNDGINDYFHVLGLERHPNTSMIIFDRNRKILYSTLSYDNRWNGDMLPEGTYFFIARFRDGIEKHGSIIIIR